MHLLCEIPMRSHRRLKRCKRRQGQGQGQDTLYDHREVEQGQWETHSFSLIAIEILANEFDCLASLGVGPKPALAAYRSL